jgi:hypothetical protein
MLRLSTICLTPVLRLLTALPVLPALIAALALSVAMAPRGAAAQEFISVPDLISDEDFYRLVACAAPPGGPCAKPLIRWPEDRRLSLRVGIVQVAASFPGYKLDLVDRAVDEAIAEINATGAALFLERAFEPPFDVPIYLVATPQGGIVRGTGEAELDGSDIAIARVALRSRRGEIQTVAIAISQDIQRREIASVVLEELVQAMGLPTDIQSPAYTRSIFAEDGNSTVWLRGQDAAALRRHYPRS